jgi:hypothetical protein
MTMTTWIATDVVQGSPEVPAARGADTNQMDLKRWHGAHERCARRGVT